MFFVSVFSVEWLISFVNPYLNLLLPFCLQCVSHLLSIHDCMISVLLDTYPKQMVSNPGKQLLSFSLSF